MIQGEETEHQSYGLTLFIRRNDLCEGVYLEYDPNNNIHKAVAGYGAHFDKRLELFTSDIDGRMTDAALIRAGVMIWERYCQVYQAGRKSKRDEIKAVMDSE